MNHTTRNARTDAQTCKHPDTDRMTIHGTSGLYERCLRCKSRPLAPSTLGKAGPWVPPPTEPARAEPRHAVQVPCTTEELAAWAEHARVRGMSLGTMARHALNALAGRGTL